MPKIADALLDCLRSVERPGDFCTGGIRDIVMPAIDVDGVGRIAFPILPEQAKRLVAIAQAAPYGRGEQTVLDPRVRKTWQIGAEQIRIGGRRWEKTLAELAADAADGLGVRDPIAAEFYKLLIYDAGSFFVDHRDTEKAPGMFATLIIVLPSIHAGGELVVRHLGRDVTLDLRPADPSEVGVAAFYADCVHEVRPVVSGHRLTLVYSLRFADRKRALQAPDYRDEQRRITRLLRNWADTEDEPDKLILPLEHAYTPAELSFSALKGADAGMASVLVGAAAEADCDVHLALVTIEESGGVEYTGNYGDDGWDHDEDNDEGMEAGEICDRALTLSEWRRPDGGEPEFKVFPFSDDELCPPDAFENLTPDEEHFQEASGNEGASFERTYSRAGLVLWPRARRLAVLNQAGLATSLPHLEELAARWAKSGAGIDSPPWREADELSRHMLRTWSRLSWRDDDDTDAGRMLQALAQLGNATRIDAFLSELSAESHYAAADNEAIVHAVALLAQPRATELLVRIVRRHAAAHLDACGDLLRRCVAAPPRSAGEAVQIAAALIDVLPGDPTKQVRPSIWGRSATVTPGFVVDLLTATSRIDAVLLTRAIEHVLAWPRTYGPDDVLVPSAVNLARHAENPAWPMAGRLREVALEHLRRRIALPLEAPRDWTRANALTCKCRDCHAVGMFLINSNERELRLKAVQDRRSHVEQSIRHAACDLEMATERRGSPHTLVATKNQASYQRRAAQRRQDLQHASELCG